MEYDIQDDNHIAVYQQDGDGQWWTCRWGDFSPEGSGDFVWDIPSAQRVTMTEGKLQYIAVLQLAQEEDVTVPGVGRKYTHRGKPSYRLWPHGQAVEVKHDESR